MPLKISWFGSGNASELKKKNSDMADIFREREDVAVSNWKDLTLV